MAEVGDNYRILILFLVSWLTDAAAGSNAPWTFLEAAVDELSGYNETTEELCQLPPYPDHGGYIVLNEKEAKPGDKFVNVSLVQYTSDENSKVFEIKRLTCSLGEWYQDILEYKSTMLQFYTSWCPYFCYSFFNDKRTEFLASNIRRHSKNARNNVSTPTELRARKDNVTSSKYCLLPPYPDKGTYTVQGNPAAKPGDIFQNVSLIQYTSDESNTVVAIEYFKCSEGTWHQKIFQKTSENLQFHTEWCPTLCSGFFGGLQSANSGYNTRDTYQQIDQKTVNANSCVLPPHLKSGKYTVLSESNPGKPGDTYEVLRLNYTCENGYSIVGNSNVYCLNGTWSHELPKCIKFCALIKLPGVEYLCENVDAVGDLRPCNDHEQDGSTIYPQCSRPYYTPKSSLKPMICENGEWSSVPQCKPVCGLRLQTEGRIETDPRIKAPWNVAVYSTNSETYNHICGGSIVASKLVISVAQCFYGNLEGSKEPSEFIVAAGKLYRSFDDPNDDKAQISNVTKIKIPPRFFSKLTSYQDDIALVFLSTPFVFNDYVLPICVNFDFNFDRIQLREARLGQVAGWGRIDKIPNNIILQVAELPVIDIKQCFSSKGYTYDNFITADKMCAGYMNGMAMCNEDSGGGFAVGEVDRSDTRRRYYFLRGIVSGHEKTLCSVMPYTMFTVVSWHKNFLRDNSDGLIA